MLLECSHGTGYDGFYINRKIIGVLNRKLCGHLDIIGVINGKVFWVLHGKLMMCILGGSEQHTQCQTSSDLHAFEKYSPTWIWCVISAGKAEWGVCKPLDICNGPWDWKTETERSEVRYFCQTMNTCNGPWDWKTETERSKVRFFVRLWIYVTGLGIEKLKLSAAKWSFLSYYENM